MKKVVVVGSINIDLIARTRHAPAAGETVNADEIFLIPGGKGANQAVGMARLGLEVTFVGRVGKDFFGTYLIHELEKENLNTSCIFQDGNAMTSIAMIILEESGDNRIIVSQGANYQISTTDIDQAIGEIEKADLVVCHFGRSHPVLNYVLQIAKSKQKKVLLNPAPAFPLSSDILKSVDYLVVNEGEAELISNSQIKDIESAYQVARELRRKEAGEVIITLGRHGSVFSNSTDQFHHLGYPVHAVDTTAAGDAFIAGFVYGTLEKWSARKRIQFANACGALASSKIGAITSLPRKSEVEQFLAVRKEAEEDPNIYDTPIRM